MSKRCDAEERWQNCERAYCQQFMKCSVAASSEPVSKLSVTSPAPTPSQQEALDAINQLGGQDPMKAVQTLRDFILARPDATIPPEDLEDMEKRITELEACVAELLGFAGADKARIAELEALRTEHHQQYTENFAKLEAANDKMRKCLEAIESIMNEAGKC